MNEILLNTQVPLSLQSSHANISTMLNYFRKDLAVHLGTFACNFCDSCDKSYGAHVRLACGHSGCIGCVATGVCQICSGLMDPISSRPRFCGPMSAGAKNNSELPTSIQDTFQLAVYQKQRISEQLRVEKELFPECIQAPVKYFNKRKSLNVSKRGKENRNTRIFPGELTSTSLELTMNKSRNFVQEWLNKQPDTTFSPQSRSPFTDLKVNTHYNQPTHSTPLTGKQKENASRTPTRQSNRKRSRLKHATVSEISLENYLKPLKKSEKKAWSAKRMKQEFDDTRQREGYKPACEESGIFIDDDCYTIEDTQDQIIDKDKMALLEVQKASINEISEPVIVIRDTEDNHSVNETSTSTKHDVKHPRVPFYKKSLLFENCTQCIANKETVSDINLKSPDNDSKNFEDVSVTVENQSFIATISIVDCSPINSGKKQSTAVQTEVQESFRGFEQSPQREAVLLIAKMKKYIETEDIDSEKQVAETESQKTALTESISKTEDEINKADENVEQTNSMMAGHSSEHNFGVLTALDGAGFQNRRRRGLRGATPDSSNSSDKENRDPNRKKKEDTKKKRKYK